MELVISVNWNRISTKSLTSVCVILWLFPVSLSRQYPYSFTHTRMHTHIDFNFLYKTISRNQACGCLKTNYSKSCININIGTTHSSSLTHNFSYGQSTIFLYPNIKMDLE